MVNNIIFFVESENKAKDCSKILSDERTCVVDFLWPDVHVFSQFDLPSFVGILDRVFNMFGSPVHRKRSHNCHSTTWLCSIERSLTWSCTNKPGMKT